MTTPDLSVDPRSADNTDLSAILTGLTREPRVSHAVLFTGDGLLLDHSDGWDRDRAETTSALLATVRGSLIRLPETAGIDGSGPLQHAVVALGGSTLLLFTTEGNTGLAVFVQASSTSRETAAAVQASVRLIHGLGPVLAARIRDGGQGWVRPGDLRA